MRITHNELIVYVTQAIRGLKLKWGSVDILSQAVADLEVIGLDAVQELVNVLNKITQNKEEERIDNLTVTPTQLSDDSLETHFQFDMQDTSAVFLFSILRNYMFEKISSSEKKIDNIQLQIINCHSQMLMTGALLSNDYPELFVTIIWRDHHNIFEYVYNSSTRNTGHNIFISEINSQENNAPLKNTLLFKISKVKPVSQLSDIYITHISNTDIEKFKADAWQNGIILDEYLWGQVQQYAKAILVPDDSESHLRAGE